MSLQIEARGLLWFSATKDGLGWRIGENWYRLRPPWMPLLFSERYGNAVVFKFMGWRLAKRRSGRPWHLDPPTQEGAGL